jgi:hypothetical protein
MSKIGLRLYAVLMATALACGIPLASGQGVPSGGSGGAHVPEPPLLPGQTPFNLSLEETRRNSRSLHFDVVGHAYFKGEWLTPDARKNGTGCGFNEARVLDGVGYFAGYDDPPSCFGVVIADVRDPGDMRVLGFIPCNAGTRCSYLRLNAARKILVVGMDTSARNPLQPTGGAIAQAGFGFYDVSTPRAPRLLAFHLTQPHGATHGFEIDDRYVYGCATTLRTKPANHQVVIIDYNDPQHPAQVGTVHIQGQYIDEAYAPQDLRNLDGSPQHIWCHEVNYHKDRIYVAWRDAGMVIVDVTDRSAPKVVSRLDYVPPFHGGASGATHTVLPIVVDPDRHPAMVVLTDEIIACPPGFGRIVNIADLANPQVTATLRIPHVTDNFDYTTGKFRCPDNGEYVHHPTLDVRSPSLLYTTWINQGLRAWDISNPFLPREVGYYLSPRYPGRFPNRQAREVYQDRTTRLIYLADANGSGITVLRWTGAIPLRPPMPASVPGAR